MTLDKHSIPSFETPETDSLFLASKNGLRTFGDLNRFTQFFNRTLQEHNVNTEKPLGFLLESCDELIMAIAACWKLGIPFCCFNPKATPQELREQIEQVDPGVIILDEKLEGTEKIDIRIFRKEIEPEKALKQVRKVSANTIVDPIKPEQIFGYFLTSGTTSAPKVVPLKRRQMLFAAAGSADNFRPDTNHFWLLCLPLNHIGGISIVLRSLLYGSGIYRMNKFDQSMVATFLTENKLFQAASLVPTMLKRLLEIPAFQTHHNFKAILLGGGPIDPDLLQTAVNKGIPLVSSYGMTETCAQIAANPLLKPSGVYQPMKSVGRLFDPNEIEIRDQSDEPVGPNTSGSIWLKGPQILDEYLDPEINKHVFDEDGWFNTGDYGHMNVYGHLFINARRTDLIITGGENVSPAEVELELEKLDIIREAAVLGLPDEEWGEQVVAAVVPNNGDTVESEQIQALLKERLSSYKIPKRILYVEKIPRNQGGKIIRNRLLPIFES